jgi:hypothetical protein
MGPLFETLANEVYVYHAVSLSLHHVVEGEKFIDLNRVPLSFELKALSALWYLTTL